MFLTGQEEIETAYESLKVKYPHTLYTHVRTHIHTHTLALALTCTNKAVIYRIAQLCIDEGSGNVIVYNTLFVCIGENWASRVKGSGISDSTTIFQFTIA